MRRALLLVCLLSVALGSSAQFITYDWMNKRGSANAAVSFSWSVNKNQRTNVPVVPTVTGNTGGITRWRWEIRDASTGALLDYSTQKVPSFTILTPGFYDMACYASNNVDVDVKITQRAFHVLPPQKTESEILAGGGIVIDLGANTDYFRNFTSEDWSGKYIGIKNSTTSGAHKVEFNNLAATSISNPCYIQVLGDATLKGGNGTAHTFWISGTSKNIIIDGYKSDGTKGLKIENLEPTNQSQMVFADGAFEGIQFYGVTFNHSLTVDGATLSMVPANGVIGAGYNATNARVLNMAVYDCVFNNCGEECNYLNYNNDHDHPSGFVPPKWINPIIAHNIYNGSGRDNFQIGGAVGVQFHNNTLSNWGQQMDIGGQTNAISWNGGSAGYCFNNIGSGGEVFLNIQSGLKPMDVFAGETVPRPSYFYNNVIWNGAYSGWSAPNEPVGVYIQNFPQSGSAGPYDIKIFHCTFSLDKKSAEKFFQTNSWPASGDVLANNIIVKTGNAGSFVDLNFTGSVVVCDAASTANLTLSGNQTIDGVVNPAVVLVKNQTTATQNGIYNTGAGAWTRNASADTDAEIQYAIAKVVTGTVGANTMWYQTTATPVIGSSNIVFSSLESNLVRNNLVREVGTESDLLFKTYTSPINASDFTLSSFSSPAYSGSPTNITSTVPGLLYYTDITGAPLLAPGQNYTFGAYSGFNKRTIAPATYLDLNAATFTSAVAVGSIGFFGGTVSFEANKIGRLYYVVVADNATAPSVPQVKNLTNATGTAPLASGVINDFGTASTQAFAGLLSGTNYDLYAVFSSIDGVNQAAVTKVDFTTTVDVTPPTISAFAIDNANRSRINFTSSEGITTATTAGFTITGRSVSSIFINGTSTTGHYFVVTPAFTQADFNGSFTIAYTAGGTPAIEDLAGNDLANFGATAITNNIAAEAAAQVLSVTSTNISASTNTFTQITSTPAVLYSNKTIASTTDGYIQFDWNTASRSGSNATKISIIDASDNAVAAGDARFYMDLSAANHNIDLWENVTGTSTYRSTWSTFGWNQSGITYRIVVDRAGGAASGWFTNQNDDKIRIFASNNGFASGTCPNNATPTANCALIGVSTNTHTMAVKFMVYFNTAGNVAANVYEQADKGLQ